MRLKNLSNKELAGAARVERNTRRFVEMSKEFISRYLRGEMVDASDMESAADAAAESNYERGFQDGQAQGRIDATG